MPDGKPNILVIWGDDIGISNLSCYSDGLMGYRTPNIDRIAAEGMRFTDSYGEQSCTGMSKVGVTVAERLTSLGYATGQFGKNHSGNPVPPQRREEPESPPTPTTTSSLGQDFAFPAWRAEVQGHLGRQADPRGHAHHTKPESVGQAGLWQSNLAGEK
jgi:arylsulfatase A-like enzyme